MLTKKILVYNSGNKNNSIPSCSLLNSNETFFIKTSNRKDFSESSLIYLLTKKLEYFEILATVTIFITQYYHPQTLAAN